MKPAPEVRGAEGNHAGSLALLRELQAYKDEMRRRFPALPEICVETWPLLTHDALALNDFLEVFHRPSVAVDIGTFTGFSSLALALNSTVLRVVSIDPNPLVHEEINEQSAILGARIGAETLEGLRVLDVAREVLSAFPDAAAKIELVEGVVASPPAHGGTRPTKRVDISDYIQGEQLIALVDGLHTPAGVRADLDAVFAAQPGAVAILDDCRHTWGPYVQAGVADFLQHERGQYRFRLLVDLSSSFARSNLGLVYSARESDAIERALGLLEAAYATFDPLAMVAREEELVRTVIETRERLDEASAQILELRLALRRLAESWSWKVTKLLRSAKAVARRPSS